MHFRRRRELPLQPEGPVSERQVHIWKERLLARWYGERLEFRRSGSIPYDLVTCQFGVEKGVDTQLTTDMITLSKIFDAAIILSGDADYLPPVAAIKAKGKLVYSVSFLNEKGRQIPGGARRLSNAVDSRADLAFEMVRQALNIEHLPVSKAAYAA